MSSNYGLILLDKSSTQILLADTAGLIGDFFSYNTLSTSDVEIFNKTNRPDKEVILTSFFLLLKNERKILELTEKFDIIDEILIPELDYVDYACIDSSENISVISTQENRVLKFTKNGARVFGDFNVVAPTSICLSLCGQIGVHSATTGLFSIFSNDLKPHFEFTLDDLGKSKAKLVDIKTADPNTSYVFYPELNKVISYVNGDQVLEQKNSFSFEASPVELIELGNVLVVGCNKKPSLYYKEISQSEFSAPVILSIGSLDGLAKITFKDI